MHRPVLVAGSVVLLLAAGVSAWALAARRSGEITVGFWFEDVSLRASEPAADRLGGPLTRAEIAAIEATARTELRAAFAGLRVRVTSDRDARWVVRVVQEISDLRFRRGLQPAAHSRGIWPFGGSGAVNFRMLASNAAAYAPAGAGRAVVLEAIGRGIGRAAAHEFAHEFLGSIDIHSGRAIDSYEYRSADRSQQYYGPMRWDVAGPLLAKRIGTTAAISSFR